MERMRAWDTWLLKDRIFPRLSPSRPLMQLDSEEALRGRLRVLRLAWCTASASDAGGLSDRAAFELLALLGQ